MAEVTVDDDQIGNNSTSLPFVPTLHQQHLQSSDDAWDVLQSLTGTVEAPADWSTEHDHYLYGTPKNQATDS